MRDQEAPPPSHHEQPFQYSLRTLFWGVTLAGLLCGVFVLLPFTWSCSLLFLAILIVAHVAGNALGTKLRDEATETAQRSLPIRSPPTRLKVTPADPPHRLCERTALGTGYVAASAVSAIAGGVFGAAILGFGGAVVSTSGLAVGAAASAVVGGLIGFLLVSFLVMFVRSISDAQQSNHSAPTNRQRPW